MWEDEAPRHLPRSLAHCTGIRYCHPGKHQASDVGSPVHQQTMFQVSIKGTSGKLGVRAC